MASPDPSVDAGAASTWRRVLRRSSHSIAARHRPASRIKHASSGRKRNHWWTCLLSYPLRASLLLLPVRRFAAPSRSTMEDVAHQCGRVSAEDALIYEHREYAGMRCEQSLHRSLSCPPPRSRSASRQRKSRAACGAGGFSNATSHVALCLWAGGKCFRLFA